MKTPHTLTRFLKKRLSTLFSLLVLLLAIYIKYADFAIVQALRLKVFDTFQTMHPRPYTDQPVRIIDIDDASLDKLGQWPWPRNLMAQVINRLNEGGAAAIAMDIVYAEPDRTSPKSILPLWHQSNKLSYLLTELPDHDDQFAEAISKANVVTSFALTHDNNTKFPLSKAGFSYAGNDPTPFLPAYEGAVTSLPNLEDAASGNGTISSTSDPDGILRRIPLALTLDGKFVPSLAAEALRVAQGAPGYIIKSVGASDEVSYGANTGVTAIKIGMFEVPTDARGTSWVYYTKYVPERYIPIWKILDPSFDVSSLEGYILFIGTSAAGLKDIRATPLNPTASGVEVHAQALEQIFEQATIKAEKTEAGEEYTERFLSRPDLMHGVEIILTALAGLFLIVVMAWLSAIWGAVFTALSLLGAFGGSWYAFLEYRILIEPVTPSIAIFLVYLSESLIRYIRAETEKKQVRNAFSHYMSPALVAQLAAHPEQLKLGGENKELTVLFCDIRGFTTISESFNDAHELTTFINRFLTPMTGIILDRLGTIDKYIGDCIMAFWNAPLDDAQHARHGCLSALKMMNSLGELNAIQEQDAIAHNRRFIPINIGIGLNTGICCVGNMGSDQRFDYSVLGDDVNLASRLEGQSKTYGVDIVIGENTQKHVADMATIEMDLIKVKGKNKPVRIFTLLGDETLAQDLGFIQLQAECNALLAAYRTQDWGIAKKLLSVCRALHSPFAHLPLEELFAMYEERIADFMANPPAEGWDGSYTATSK